MPFFIVGQDTNFERIAGNLLRSGATTEALTDLRRRLVEANPGLDLDRLAPGTVIDVPRRPGMQAPSGDGSPPPAARACRPRAVTARSPRPSGTASAACGAS